MPNRQTDRPRYVWHLLRQACDVNQHVSTELHASNMSSKQQPLTVSVNSLTRVSVRAMVRTTWPPKPTAWATYTTNVRTTFTDYCLPVRFFSATRFLFFLFLFFLYFFSFLCRALDKAVHLVRLWVHVNLPYRIVSYRIVRSKLKTDMNWIRCRTAHCAMLLFAYTIQLMHTIIHVLSCD